MKLNKEEARELLRKYRLGQSSKKELEIIERWYRSFDKDEDEKIDFSGTGNLDEIRKQMLENITSKINQTEQNFRMMQDEGKPVRRMNLLNFENLKRIAAVLLVGAGIGVFLYERNHMVIKEEKAQAEEIAPKEILPSTIYLSDGSVVWLKGESRLEYPKSFKGGVREVTLIGEAFFDVAKDETKPFIIHSSHFTTRVLGTSFNIKAYEDDESQEVEVITGKVVVSVKEPSFDKVKELILKSHQKAIYSKKDNSLVESVVADRVIHNSSSKSKLVFSETLLSDIIIVLNATHDANISLAEESMKNCIITADLRNEPLETSIAILSKAINAEYTIKGKDIILTGNGCGNEPINN